eukprot:jgi/Galph1/6001/GphlegSOOS_G4668.1
MNTVEKTATKAPSSPPLPPVNFSQRTVQKPFASPVRNTALHSEKSNFPSSQGKVTIGNFKKRLTRKVTAALSSDLESAVLKATKPKYSRPKEKHVAFLLQATKGCGTTDNTYSFKVSERDVQQSGLGSLPVESTVSSNFSGEEKNPQRELEKSQSSLFNLENSHDRHLAREKSPFIRTCDVLRKLWKKMQAEDWRIATKALIVLHRLINESSPPDAYMIKIQLLRIARHGVDASAVLNKEYRTGTVNVDIGHLSTTFQDHSRNRPEAAICSTFLKKYGKYMSRRLELFHYLAIQLQIRSFNEIGMIMDTNHMTSVVDSKIVTVIPILLQLIEEGTICRIEENLDRTIEVVVVSALELIASDITSIYNFINRIFPELSFQMETNFNISREVLKTSYDNFIRLEAPVRNFIKYTCSSIEDVFLDGNNTVDARNKTHFSSIYELDKRVIIDFATTHDSVVKEVMAADVGQQNESKVVNEQFSDSCRSFTATPEKEDVFDKLQNASCENTSKKEDKSDEQKLLQASFSGDTKEVLRLILSGVSVNVCNDDLRTPLHLAAAVGHLEIVQLLLEYGGSVNVTDCRGKTPLADAIRGNHQKVIECLQSYGGSTPTSSSSSPSVVVRKQPLLNQFKSMSSPSLSSTKSPHAMQPKGTISLENDPSDNIGEIKRQASQATVENIEAKELELALQELQMEYDQHVSNLELEMRKRKLELDEQFAKRRTALLMRHKQRYRRASFGI